MSNMPHKDRTILAANLHPPFHSSTRKYTPSLLLTVRGRAENGALWNPEGIEKQSIRETGIHLLVLSCIILSLYRWGQAQIQERI